MVVSLLSEGVQMDLPHWPGWYLIGRYESDVGSWLLHDGGEAALLEVPEGLTVKDVQQAVDGLGCELRYITASHDHYDHIDAEVWDALAEAFPEAECIHPASLRNDRLYYLDDEPLWLIKAPKHSPCDVVTVFRGAAMTGDIELGTLDSVSAEVPLATRKRSMRWLRDFRERHDYHVHSVISAHLDDVRQSVDWPALFDC